MASTMFSTAICDICRELGVETGEEALAKVRELVALTRPIRVSEGPPPLGVKVMVNFGNKDAWSFAKFGRYDDQLCIVDWEDGCYSACRGTEFWLPLPPNP